MATVVLPTLDRPRPVARLREPHLKPSWPLVLLFGGLFVWWILGLSGFIQFVFAVPMLFSLAVRGNVRMPRSFWIWLTFIVLMFISALMLKWFPSQSSLSNLMSWGWRMTLYVAGTVIFLYVYNASRERLQASTLVNILAGFWILTVLGGLVGMARPNRSWHSLMFKLLPHALTSNAFVKALVIPATTGGKAFPGLGIYRVKAPFIYTNQWGSAFALTLPFALAVVTETKSTWVRRLMLGLLVLGIIPLVFSLDRGSWLSAAVVAVYGVVRMSRSGRGRTRRMARAARSMMIVGVLAIGLIIVSPLGHDVLTRSQNGYGDTHRVLLYSNSLSLATRSPLLGFGSPVSLDTVDPMAPPGPSIGTHGSLWTVLTSNGIPALCFFCLWFLYALFRTYKRITPEGGRNSEAYFWCHVAILAAVVQIPYYELLPWGLMIVMIAIAVCFRELSVPIGRPRNLVRRPLGWVGLRPLPGELPMAS